MAFRREQATVLVDGVRLSYEERGQGRPLVFVHGLAASSASWREVAEALSDDCRTVCLDLMGFGRSAKPPHESYTLARQGSLLRQLLPALGLEGALLIGHSYGGGVCLQAARTDQEGLVKGLVLADPVCYAQPLPLSFRLLRLPVLGPLGLRLAPKEWMTRAGLERGYGGRRRAKSELVSSYAAALTSAEGRHALTRTIAGLAEQSRVTRHDYGQITIPTLLIWGRHDHLVPVALGRRLEGELPNAQFLLFDDCGHLPQEEEPRRTADAISDFLRRVPLR
jgi:pimeloyl-ACP methyl ester carboxylesterase